MIDDCEIFNCEKIAKRYGMTTKQFLSLASYYQQEMVKQYAKMVIRENEEFCQKKDSELIKTKKLFERKKR